MDFPSHLGKPVEITDAVISALGICPIEIYQARDLLAIYESELQIRDFRPDFGCIASIDTSAITISAPGDLNGHLKGGHLWSLQNRPFNRERVRQDSFSFLPPDQASPF